jgi:hypothetical protein
MKTRWGRVSLRRAKRPPRSALRFVLKERMVRIEAAASPSSLLCAAIGREAINVLRGRKRKFPLHLLLPRRLEALGPLAAADRRPGGRVGRGVTAARGAGAVLAAM